MSYGGKWKIIGITLEKIKNWIFRKFTIDITFRIAAGVKNDSIIISLYDILNEKESEDLIQSLIIKYMGGNFLFYDY